MELLRELVPPGPSFLFFALYKLSLSHKLARKSLLRGLFLYLFNLQSYYPVTIKKGQLDMFEWLLLNVEA